MSPIKDHQKQLLFDYCIGLTSQEQSAEAQALISDSGEAAEIHSKLKAALAPLEAIQPEPCPDDLAERTVMRLNNLARSSQLRLQQLLADEQARGAAVKFPFWHKLGKIATAAAVFMIAWGIFQTSTNYARQRYYQNRCQAQLGGIFQGLTGRG
jgi:anti-sigma-K factor RskA